MKNTPMPSRRAPMAPGNPLERRTSLERGGEMPRKPWAPKRKATGFPESVKLAARKRAGGGDPEEAACESCGKWLGRHGGEIQHRRARGAGGCTAPVINGISNAAVLCGTSLDKQSCHGRCEARDPEMEARGWWISSGAGPEHDPRFVPVLPALVTDLVPVYLAESGLYATERPAGSTA